jgi:NTE family protein
MTTVTAGAPAPPAPAAGADRDPGLTLCLSGGGFRATLFHLGALERLNELGVLSAVKVITSVSGGSILNGILATRWAGLQLGAGGRFANFDEVARAARALCARDLRTRLLLLGRLNPANLPELLRGLGSVPANWLAGEYDRPMLGRRLADLPAPGAGAPRFVFCATSVQTGACWHFHGGPGGRMGDFYTGYCGAGWLKVSEAVAASSAFPPGFGALRLRLPADAELTRTDPWGEGRPAPAKRKDLPGGGKRLVLLTDGGVYDNLGVEPVWGRSRALLISDAGRPFESVPDAHQWAVPRLRRAFEVSAEQVGAVRKRWLVERFALARQVRALREACPGLPERPELWRGLPARSGALWAINTRLEDFELADARGYGRAARALFPAVRTDLNAFTAGEIACLENHGYSLADAALRSHARDLCPNPGAEFRWPAPGWCEDGQASAALAGSGRRFLPRDLWGLLRGLLPRRRPAEGPTA